VTERVKPHRDPIVARGKQVHEYDYWKFWDKRLDSYARVGKLKRVIVASLASKYVLFDMTATGIVFAHRLGVVIDDRQSVFSLLQSNIHSSWAWKCSSTIGGVGISYALSDAFETFPFPDSIECLERVGGVYLEARRMFSQSRNEGLTDIYNRIHNIGERSDDVTQFRDLIVQLDQAVVAAYGWNDLNLGHGFHETKQGMRYTISDTARGEVLDRLLALNHKRHAQEEAMRATSSVSATAKRGRKPEDTGGQITMDL
jgi:hypothetical protein